MAGYAMQISKGFNPFLAETDPSSTPQFPFQESQVSNPFLSNFTQDFSEPEPETRISDNPFLNYSAAAVAPSGASNPFADFFENASNVNVKEELTWPNSIDEAKFVENDFVEATNMIFPDVNERRHLPERPPPPSVPRSTQDLLETVTGALEATSDSLLDRLRVTQPSPIPHNPCPTPSPRTPSPDLWGEDHMPAPPPSANSVLHLSDQSHSIMDMFDVPQSVGHKSSFEILGLYGRTAQPVSVALPTVAVVDLFSMDEPQTEVTKHVEFSAPEIPQEKVLQQEMLLELKGTERNNRLLCKPDPVQNIAERVYSEPESSEFESLKFQEIFPPPIIHQQPPSVISQQPAPIILQQPSPAILQQHPAIIPQQPLPVISQRYPPIISPKHLSYIAEQPPTDSPHQPLPLVEELPQSIVAEEAPPIQPAAIFQPTFFTQHQQPFTQDLFQVQPDSTQIPNFPMAAPEEKIAEISAAKPPERPKPPPPMRSPAPTRAPSRPPPPVPPSPRTCHPLPPRTVPLQQLTSKQMETEVDISVHVQSSSFASEVKATFIVPTTTDVKVFDIFDAKFEGISSEKSFGQTLIDPFGDTSIPATQQVDNLSAWGNSSSTTLLDWGDAANLDTKDTGFGNKETFDSFLAMTEPPPVPQSTPSKLKGNKDYDFDKEEPDISIFIRPKSDDCGFHLAPALAPPPKSPAISTGSNFSEDSSSFVPFLSSVREPKDVPRDLNLEDEGQVKRSDSQDSPQTPLYEEDQSQPLEDFPRTKYTGNGWDMHMRHPNKKKITGQRFWKKVFVQISAQNDIPIVQVFNTKTDKDPIQEIPLQPCYSVSDINTQQFDQFGKIFTIKLQYVFYKERPGVRPGQITKAERITTKLSQFAAYAIQGDYQGCKEFGSDLRKLGLPLEHAPQISQLAKLGTQVYEEMKQFSMCIEEALFRLPVHRDRAINYKTEEVQVTLVDEYYIEQDIHGVVLRQIARVRLFFLSFLSGSTEVELGVNDMRRQGKEVVGRHDIIPIATEEWIRIEDVELSNCVQLDEFDRTKMFKFKPPDACYIELMRFRVRPPKHRELPLQVKTVFITTGNRIEIRSDILVPGFTSRKLGQIPCEDVMVLIPIPECWIYMFRVEKHFRYGSVKSAHRRSGKVKGIERFLGAVETVEQSLMEVTSGQAKYEHQHKGIVWRVARLPKEGQGAYTTHSFFCHITLQPHEQIPENLTKHCYVEFTMPHTTISHTVCRSIAVPSCDEPPEKCVRYLSRHEYIVEIEHSSGVAPATYNLAASVVPKDEPKIEEDSQQIVSPPAKEESDSEFSDD